MKKEAHHLSPNNYNAARKHASLSHSNIGQIYKDMNFDADLHSGFVDMNVNYGKKDKVQNKIQTKFKIMQFKGKLHDMVEDQEVHDFADHLNHGGELSVEEI